MKHSLYILFFLFPLISIGQNFTPEEQQEIDSINLIIDNPKSTDLSIARAYVNLSNILYISNIDTIVPLSLEAIRAIKKGLANNPSESDKRTLLKYKADALNNIAYLYIMKGESAKAIDYYNKAKRISEKINDKPALSSYYVGVGYIYDNTGNIEKALEYYHKSLKINEELNDKTGMSVALNNIGSIYNDQGYIDKALEYYTKSLKLSRESNDIPGVAQAYNNIGYVYDHKNDLDKGLEYYNKALEIFEKIEDKAGIASSYSNIGHIYKLKGEIETSLGYYNKGLKVYKEVGDKEGVTYMLNNIATIQMDRGELQKAKTNAIENFSIARELGYPSDIRAAAAILSKIYEKEGNNMKALEMYKLSIVMRDSLNNEATQKASAKQQAKYEYEKQKAIDDAEHDKQLAIEHEAAEKQQIITYTTTAGLALVGIFLLVVFNRLKVTRKQKLVIEDQKQEVEQQKTVVEEAHHELEEKNKEITDSIQYAKRIQNAILPADKTIKTHLSNSFVLYKPKDIVAGDFYWLETVSSLEGGLKKGDHLPSNSLQEENLVLFAAADCTGHGVPGAMVSVVCHNALNRSVREYGLTDPAEILNKTREIVIAEFEKSDEEVQDGMDIALCCLKGNTLQYAGANNPLWIIHPVTSSADEGSVSGSEQELIETKPDKQPIGKFDNPKPYTTHTIELQKEDSIYIFSDGYIDQFGGDKGKKFKTKAFKELLLSIQKEPMEKQRTLINEAFEKWRGNNEQVDDVCIIGVRI